MEQQEIIDQLNQYILDIYYTQLNIQEDILNYAVNASQESKGMIVLDSLKIAKNTRKIKEMISEIITAYEYAKSRGRGN